MSFRDDIAKFAKKTDQSVKSAVVGACFQLSEAIIMRTPVDTGRARGNWIAAVDEVDDDTGRAGDKVGQVALMRAKKTAEEAFGKLFYLTNSLPYIRVLEYGQYGTGPGATIKTTRDGYSVQAPYGMVRVSVLGFEKALKDAIR